MKKGMFVKAKEVLSKPISFFKSLDEGIKPAFYYSLVLGFISMVLGVGYAMFSYPELSTNSWTYLLALILWIAGTLLNFISAGIVHLFVMLFGGKGRYSKTYGLFVYSSTPAYLLGWIPYVNYVTAIWTVGLLVIGTMYMHKLSRTKAILLYLSFFALMTLIAAAIAYWLVISAPSLA